MSYSQFCPIAKASEIIGEKWVIIILRELLVGTDTFSALKNYIPQISPTLLSKRLVELEDDGIVLKKETGLKQPKYKYLLTPAGQELGPIIFGLGEWGVKWTISHLKKEDYDPKLLMWDISRSIKTDILSAHDRYVVEFECRGVEKKYERWWLIINKGKEADVCYKNRGFEVNLEVQAHIKTLVEVWMGYIPLKKALRDEKLKLDGLRKDISAFPKWFSLNYFANLPSR